PGAQSREAYEALIDRALTTGEGGRIELLVPDAKGELGVHSIVVVAERDDNGLICGAVAVGREITDLFRMRELLAARERAFRSLAENSPDVIIRYGLDRRAIYCNREIGQQVALREGGVVGRTPSESAPPGMEGVENYERQLVRTLASGEGGTVELIVPHP